MPISERTKTKINASIFIQDKDDLYPDRDASGNLVASLTLRRRLSDDDVPRTSKDMSRLFMWEHGDKIYGTEAKLQRGMKMYMEDINKAWGREKDYESNMIFIDTTKPIGKQLKELK